MSRFQVKICVSLAIFCVYAASVFGQGTDLGAVRGLVTDPSGGTVPNATVTIIDLATDSRTTTKTNSAGEYEANSLKAGSYKISIAATGFSTVEITGVTLRAGSSARADARLEVAHTGESVVVQAEAPLTEMDLPTISSTLSGLDMVELPRDSRDFTSFLYLNPNIRQGTTTDRSSSWARRVTAPVSPWTASEPTAASSASRLPASRRSRRSGN